MEKKYLQIHGMVMDTEMAAAFANVFLYGKKITDYLEANTKGFVKHLKRENIKNFKTRSNGGKDPLQKLNMKTENENAQASTLRQEISTVITKFEKHTYEQMTFDTKPAITHWRYSRNLP